MPSCSPRWRAGPAHGYAIIETIKRRSAGTFDLPEGTVYPALHRLEQAGLLSSAWMTPPSGRRRRVYSLTRAVGALAERRKAWGRSRRQSTPRWKEGAHGRRDRRLRRSTAPRARLRSRAGPPAGDEVEDHLRDAAGPIRRGRQPKPSTAPSSASASPRDRRAIRGRCGRSSGERTWIALAVTVVVTFVAMRLRVMWLAITSMFSMLGAADRPLCLHRRTRGRRGRLARLSPLGRAGDLPGRPRGVDRRRHRARRLVRRGAPTHVLLAAAGEIALIGVLSVPCRWLGPAGSGGRRCCGGPG